MSAKEIDNVRALADQFDVWGQVLEATYRLLGMQEATCLLAELSVLPVRKSRATRTLGTYVSRAGEAVCLRLQFALEPELLKETFLHELAHACDHLSNQSGRPYRRAHGSGWKKWATALGAKGEVKAQSEALSRLYREKLKLVAVCSRCGVKFQRIRRLNHRQKYIHQLCGGQINPL